MYDYKRELRNAARRRNRLLKSLGKKLAEAAMLDAQMCRRRRIREANAYLRGEEAPTSMSWSEALTCGFNGGFEGHLDFLRKLGS